MEIDTLSSAHTQTDLHPRHPHVPLPTDSENAVCVSGATRGDVDLKVNVKLPLGKERTQTRERMRLTAEAVVRLNK